MATEVAATVATEAIEIVTVMAATEATETATEIAMAATGAMRGTAIAEAVIEIAIVTEEAVVDVMAAWVFRFCAVFLSNFF